MISKTVSPPFNVGRLITSLRNLLGQTRWTYRISSDAASIIIEVEEGLILFLHPGVQLHQAEALVSADLDAAIAVHQSNFDVDELALSKTRAYEAIDFRAGEVSRKYVTDRTAQEITYQLKMNSSTLWAANGKPTNIDRATYPGLYGEVMAYRAVDPQTSIQTVVDAITATASQWYVKADQIEEQRRKGKILVSFATNATQVMERLNAALTALDQL